MLVSVVPPVLNFKFPLSVAWITTSPAPADWMVTALALVNAKVAEAKVDLILGVAAATSRSPTLLIYGTELIVLPGGKP
ncbi:MAG: hypothetical protein UY44_C0020G0010 [Candidatus Kaiserbacteria bacterium GW2011_GWA2_49_19]|uniref:Uncharacterized protein n=1 Tax=Candidatus Kaiserbacteria bacterium GW2011_GWA2_49_19 TaxID=1618669 RepID=A0A0G1YNR7_9BACT|nr:MAG: hypothetical protein UY44_C0020G0010 [Candidatus Kaiserbacteria bacterium GW2011_GWA2_49_19]